MASMFNHRLLNLPYFPVYKRPSFAQNFHFKNRGSLIHGSKSNAMDGTEDNAIFEQSDSSDDNDEELANIAEGLTPVDISDESDEEFNGFYDE